MQMIRLRHEINVWWHDLFKEQMLSTMVICVILGIFFWMAMKITQLLNTKDIIMSMRTTGCHLPRMGSDGIY